MTTESQKAFEEWFFDYGALAQPMFYFTEHMSNCWHAGIAYNRQHIIDKLQSEEMVERVGKAIANGDRDLNECSKQVIAAVLEGI